MSLNKVLLSFLLLAAVSCLGEKARYDNYKLVKVVPTTTKQVDILMKLETANVGYSFWVGATKPGREVHVMVPPHKLAMWSEFVVEHGFTSEVLQSNIQRGIDEQELKRRYAPKEVEWTEYHDLDELYAWLDDLESQNPGVVQVVKAGSTYEGRDIKGITINFNSNNPGVIFEAGIHAREWIGPAATSWIVNEVLNSPEDSIWRRFNYLYIPSANPDGYVYTWTDDRLWRKTRIPYEGIFGTCYGADPNRNWDIEWNTVGTDSDPCFETYAGPSAFSEIESKSLSEYYSQVGKSYDIYVAFHSYSQLLMYPWGYTNTPIPTASLHQRIGDLAVQDLEDVNGLHFDCGNIYDTIYPVSGSSIEWFYAKFNNTLTYTFETRDTGRYGFVLPPEQILPGAKELQAAVKRFLVEYENL